MVDANMSDFYDRVRRFERMRSQGLGFEAPDTLGRSFYNQRFKTKRFNLAVPLVICLTVVFGLKGALYEAVGAASYDQRVARLQAGEGIDPVGGWLMQADPVTVWVAGKIDKGLTLIE